MHNYSHTYCFYSIIYTTQKSIQKQKKQNYKKSKHSFFMKNKKIEAKIIKIFPQ